MMLEDLMKEHGISSPEDLSERTGISLFWIRGFWYGNFGFEAKGLAKSKDLSVIAESTGLSIREIIDCWHESRWTGHVYIFQSETLYKIGRSWDPDRRFRAIKSKFPSLFYLHSIYSNDMRRLEHAFHRCYAKYRVKGEWFSIPEEDIEMICLMGTIRFKHVIL